VIERIENTRIVKGVTQNYASVLWATAATAGLTLKVGDRARNVQIGNNLSPVPLARSQERSAFPYGSFLDMPVCSVIQKFSQHLTSLGQELTDFVEVFFISADLPFAQSRWQTIEKVANITMLSITAIWILPAIGDC